MGCPKNPPTGEHPKGAVDGWHPEQSPGTRKIEVPGPGPYLYGDHLVWLVDGRVLVTLLFEGLTEGLQTRRQWARDTQVPNDSWDLEEWDGKAPQDVFLWNKPHGPKLCFTTDEEPLATDGTVPVLTLTKVEPGPS